LEARVRNGSPGGRRGDDNCITVFPGETAAIRGIVQKDAKLRWVKLEGYNTPAISVPVK
jgi:hypothetical protein